MTKLRTNGDERDDISRRINKQPQAGKQTNTMSMTSGKVQLGTTGTTRTVSPRRQQKCEELPLVACYLWWNILLDICV